jgi:DNA repair exonuclease SbcCD ATPase subunit
MRVRTVELQGCFSHGLSRVTFPPTGLVLISGPNGAGKSSIIEAVPYACWGKTLRGTPPWELDSKGLTQAQVDIDGMTLRRWRKSAKASLRWAVANDGTESGKAFDALSRLDPNFESKTQSQEALDTMIGSFDVWRRSHVFSSSDVAHFSLATDGERKRLLETVLGLDRFDDALGRCREDIKNLETEQQRASVQFTRNEAALRAQERRLEDARAVCERAHEGLPERLPCPTEDEIKDLRRLVTLAEREKVRVQRLLRDAQGESARAGAQADLAQRTHAKMCAMKDCPTCGQAMPPTFAAKAKTELDAAQKAADAAKAETEKAEASHEAELEELTESLGLLTKKLNDATVQADRAREREHARTRAYRELEAARETFEAARQDVENVRFILDGLTEELGRLGLAIATLKDVETVLGLRGVRAHILGQSLSGLEALANVWLPRFGLPLSVTISPYSEKKTGGTIDAINIEVEGAGGGHGYKASSAGERRRIDLALLLAISEVSTAASGREPGTLFFDEPFEGLHIDGVDALAAALEDLARTRCVVVITHRPDIAERLKPAKKIDVDAGHVTERWERTT